MKIWLDAHLSPSLAKWITATFDEVTAHSAYKLGLLHASDREIFEAARRAEAVLMTKDSDMVRLLEQQGPPPNVIWITCGNTSNARMRELLLNALPQTLALLEHEPLVEISDR